MAVVCTFDGLNLNDRSLYFLMPEFDPGRSELTFDEFPSYAGGVAVRVRKRRPRRAAAAADRRARGE